MPEIKCPKCHEVFSVDESDYNEIVKQIRDKIFKEEVEQRIKIEVNNKNNEFELTKKNIETENIKKLLELNSEIEMLKLPNFGRKSLNELKENLRENGIPVRL